MNKKFLLVIVAVLFLLAIVVQGAEAQENPQAQIIWINSPISSELRQALDEWLLVSPPSSAVYHAVTYTQPTGTGTYVSMVGLNIENPDDYWSIIGDEEGNPQVVWLNTLLVAQDGTVTYPFGAGIGEQSRINKLARSFKIPVPIPGGGAYVRFPFQPAKAVKYGASGFHIAGFDLSWNSGWGAVDLISGSDMGSGAANDSVYASAFGTVTYICESDTVAIVTDGPGGEFLYAHLLPNASLEMGQAYQAGQVIGTLKHGSFVNTCGHAVQSGEKWHLHWGFVSKEEENFLGTKNFNAEGCIMTKSAFFTSGVWRCGTKTIKVNGYLEHYGNIGLDPDGGGIGTHLLPGQYGSGSGPSFWNYLLAGLKGIFDYFVTNNLPEHESSVTLLNPILTSVKIVFRIALVLLHGNFNFIPAVQMVGFTIGIRLAFSTLFVVIGIYRIIR
ncbi:MAG: hypothetical protein QY332_14695 [Anaerolineales bacterium]|nr:MAG: hypothetical protein QY332_14695 [Anaerolineales bacterium]